MKKLPDLKQLSDEARLERYRSNLRERLTRILSLMPYQPDGVRLRKRYGESRG